MVSPPCPARSCLTFQYFGILKPAMRSRHEARSSSPPMPRYPALWSAMRTQGAAAGGRGKSQHVRRIPWQVTSERGSRRCLASQQRPPSVPADVPSFAYRRRTHAHSSSPYLASGTPNTCLQAYGREGGGEGGSGGRSRSGAARIIQCCGWREAQAQPRASPSGNRQARVRLAVHDLAYAVSATPAGTAAAGACLCIRDGRVMHQKLLHLPLQRRKTAGWKVIRGSVQAAAEIKVRTGMRNTVSRPSPPSPHRIYVFPSANDHVFASPHDPAARASWVDARGCLQHSDLWPAHTYSPPTPLALAGARPTLLHQFCCCTTPILNNRRQQQGALLYLQYPCTSSAARSPVCIQPSCIGKQVEPSGVSSVAAGHLRQRLVSAQHSVLRNQPLQNCAAARTWSIAAAVAAALPQ